MEQLEETEAADNTEAETDQAIEVQPHRRKKRGRKLLPEHLPRIEIIYDLDAADKVCPHDGHALKHIGDEISKHLDVIPAKLQVSRRIRHK